MPKEFYEWIDAKKIWQDVLNKDFKCLNKHLSKICKAFIQVGCYDFQVKICMNSDKKMARIYRLPTELPYFFMLVFEDGYYSMHSANGNIQYEGHTRFPLNL